jgi:YidC/Oxa1 family membrane protein insertase
MDKQSIRLIFWFAIFAVGVLLYNAWQNDARLKQEQQQQVVVAEKKKNDIPEAVVASASKSSNDLISAGELEMANVDPARVITVTTDVFNLKIDTKGGDIIFLDLPKYPATLDNPDQGFVLLAEAKDRFYVVQTGLLNELGPDSASLGRASYSFSSSSFVMDEDESIMNVDMNYTTRNGVSITKRYIFTRGSYDIRLHYIIDNKSSSNYEVSTFGRIKRTAPVSESSGMFGSMRTYTGAAVNTPDKRYQKVSFSDMQKNNFSEDVMGGWAAMVEHYFATAIVPSVESKNYFQSENFGGDLFGIRFVSEAKIIPPGVLEIIETKIYAGPEVAAQLKQVAPGLELTIDYGFLWFICQPIFWLLRTMHELLGNWGVAIIATTVIIKAMFYKLSATSYKSMGNMRKLQPKIETLKQRYGDDKQGFSKAMMELYRKEKVNPLGGCLPILVQIPVFIALYYVLLESVELRQAPFMLWIHDLSAKDPYYVLPIIMGISMLIQQRLNPTPPDPMQAKVMMVMPIFFTFLFLQFPSGLVLYWVVNNILSILQQWYITRRIERAAA